MSRRTAYERRLILPPLDSFAGDLIAGFPNRAPGSWRPSGVMRDGLGLMGHDDHTPRENADLTTLASQTKRAAVLMYRLSRVITGDLRTSHCRTSHVSERR